MSKVKLSPENKSAFALIDFMSERDLQEVAEIETLCGLSRWGYDAYAAELFRPEAFMLVARREEFAIENNMKLQGFIAARMAGRELHINNIAVRPESRRKKIGGRLLRAVLELAAVRGAERAFLEVRASNIPAQELYLRNNFQIAGRRENYYRTPPEDALVMTASIFSAR